MTAACSSCKGPVGPRQHRYCNDCHAAYMRRWRQTHPMTAEQRKKDNARSYAGTYLRRGRIARKDCEECGSPNSQMHHHDYDRPLDVKWLCRPCHAIEHGAANFRPDIGHHPEPMRRAA